MSGSRWVIIPLWLSGSWRSFCIVLLCILATSYKYLLLLLCPYHFCPLLGPSLNEMFSFISLIFLKRSLVFPFYCLYWSLRKTFLSTLAILWNCIQMGISFLFSFAFCLSKSWLFIISSNFTLLQEFSIHLTCTKLTCAEVESSGLQTFLFIDSSI